MILIIVLATFATLFFSVAAFSLRNFSHARLQEAFKSMNKEEKADVIIENDEKLALTCSVFRMILNACILLLILGVFSTLRQEPPLPLDYMFTFLIAAAIFSVFSIAVPHAWAKYAGEITLCRTYKLLVIFAFLAWPVLAVFHIYDMFVRRMAGIPQTTPENEQEEKQEEFITDLEHHRIEGAVDKEEQRMIEKVLDLRDTAVDAIMTPRTDVVAVELENERDDVLRTINNAGHSRLPVYKDTIDNVVGMVYAKDLLTEISKNPSDFKLADKLRKAYFVPETKLVRTLLHEFQNQKLHIAVVLDEYGGTAGIVTLEDILEELVGEITDEYEKTPPEPVKTLDENTIQADARINVGDLNDEFDADLPEDEDYDTIGGFVFSYLGYIPKTGETFDYRNLRFTITSAEPRRIKQVTIRKIPFEQ